MEGLDEVDKLRGFFHSSSLVAILDFLWSPIFLATIFLIHWTIGWVVVARARATGHDRYDHGRAFAKDRDERFNGASNKIGELKDMLLVSRDVIQSQQMTAAYNERWVRARRSSRDRAVELNDWNGWFATSSKHAAMLMQYSVLAAGAYLTLSDQLTIGAMVACMFLSVRVFYPVERFLKQLPAIRQATADWKNLDRILKSVKPALVHPDVGAEGLSLSQLTVRSPLTRQKLLRNMDMVISAGSAVEDCWQERVGKDRPCRSHSRASASHGGDDPVWRHRNRPAFDRGCGRYVRLRPAERRLRQWHHRGEYRLSGRQSGQGQAHRSSKNGAGA